MLHKRKLHILFHINCTKNYCALQERVSFYRPMIKKNFRLIFCLPSATSIYRFGPCTRACTHTHNYLYHNPLWLIGYYKTLYFWPTIKKSCFNIKKSMFVKMFFNENCTRVPCLMKNVCLNALWRLTLVPF